MIDSLPQDQLREDSNLDALLDQLEGVVVWSAKPPDGGDLPEFTYISSGFEEVWSIPREIALDEPSRLLDMIPADDRESIKGSIEDAVYGDEPERIEHRVVRPDGEVRWVEVRVHSSVDDSGGVSGVYGIAIDITDRKEVEEELERKTERLEKFSSILSHDLRNPLNVAKMSLELAYENPSEENLDKISHSLNRMNGLVNDLLSLARKGDDALDYQEVNLEEVTRNAWNNVLTKEADINIEADEPIRADESRLKQLFENLFRNAVEHGGKDVTVTVGETEDGFYIEDDGSGIPHESINEMFQDLDSLDFEKTGYGLYIVGMVVRNHGWNIRATESDDGGARFEITGV